VDVLLLKCFPVLDDNLGVVKMTWAKNDFMSFELIPGTALKLKLTKFFYSVFSDLRNSTAS